MNNRDDMFGAFLPKTVIGVAVWMLMFSLGVAVSGLIFFFIYQGRVNSLEDRLIDVEQTVDKRVDEKIKKLQDQIEESKDSRSLRVSGTGFDRVAKSVANAIAKVEGQDINNAPTRGSGFVVKSTGSEAWVITNQHLVAGSVAKNLPVRVRLGSIELDSEVYASDPARDLAVLIFKSGQPRSIRFASSEPEKNAQVGVVGVSATGFQPETATGRLVDSSPSGLLTDAKVPKNMSGGPLLDESGNVLGVISTRDETVKSSPKPSPKSAPKPAAAAKAEGNIRAVPIRLACLTVLRCPGSGANPSPSASPGKSARPLKPPATTPSPVPIPGPVEDRGRVAPG